MADGSGVAETTSVGAVCVDFCKVAESVANGLVSFDLQPMVINRTETRIANVLKVFI